MVQSSLKEQRCLNHTPEWKDVGEERYEPNPEIFGLKKTHWGRSTQCCGRQMLRCRVVRLQECQKCGRQNDRVIVPDFAVCSCCGRGESRMM